MKFLITVIVVVILLVGVVSSCPSVCSCHDYPSGFYVDCYNIGLDSIPTDLPNNTYNLQLQNNKISVIKENTFNNTPRLFQLWLINNDISVIENNAFNNLPNFECLYLQYNKITSIKSDMFNNLPNFNRLDIDHNQISVIENKDFKSLPNLKYLWLDHNNLSVITGNTFHQLPKIRYLYLYFNKITSIKFINLTNFSLLELQYNDISVIENNTFNNLPNLFRLYLHNNKITSIKSDTFNNLPSLRKLRLDNNDISVIEDKAFNNLPMLQIIRMENNPITFVSEHAFENLPQLTSLNFDMHCGSCDNFPFWRWLKETQRYPTSITCNDFDGEYLPSVQLNNVTDCSVHGNWDAWGAWSSCSETCGSGVLTRYRTCSNPPPANGGSYCQGNNDETTSCLTTPCPVHGNWGTWADWNSCSLTCGSGSRSRRQECNNPKPAYGGSHCQGNDTAIDLCSIKLCPVHGNWGTWKDWNSCSLTCGSGSISRRQECNNPEPAYGGSDCQGNDTEIESCSIELCPVASEEDSSSAAIGIGAGIGSTAVVVGLLIVFVYILRRYRLRKAAESAIYDTSGDTRSSNSDLHIYDGLQPNTESPTHRQNEVIYVNMVI